MNKKWDIHKANQLFSGRNCELLESEYINNKTPMKYIAECGHEHMISVDNFTRGKGTQCKSCRYVYVGNVRRIPYEEVKQHFMDNGCKLTSRTYTDNSQKLTYIAQCGHKNKLEFSKFKMGAGRVCNKCSKSIRYEYDYVFEKFSNDDCFLLESEYINCKTPMRYVAKCGHESTISFDVFLNAEKATKKCDNCHLMKYSEVPIDRQLGAMDHWTKAVYKRDGFNCQKCGKHGGKINAHHINAYNSHVEGRFDIDNGITLCEPCHIQFHRTYGYGKNTRKQLNHWFDGNTEVKHTLKGVAHRNA